MTVKKRPPIAFEAALGELETLVGQLEQGELTLEEALERFEQGISLVRTCQTTLQAAEQKVNQLIERNGQAHIVPFGETAV